nr:integrase, catalytic region, zinc finger, CCHC-type, peptidase aspartic, catalytic [Tanacetum cinerariifolium]GEZ56520.1 integrase, catalytic region, zinc finger, CCHC-type, peptidase aspartic, catalytic [Tanacetum cinerariifolium]
MTGDRSQLINFVQKFLATVKFVNDHVAKIMGYGDYQNGNVRISRVYYVEGLWQNLFSVRQFCDSDLEVAFCQHTCFIRNLEGVDLLTDWSLRTDLDLVYWNRSRLFLGAFQVTVDVPEMYMQEFWATAKLHHNSIRFKIDSKKSFLDLEAFREMLHISPRIPNQSFADLPTEEEIMDFLRFLGHSHEIRYLTDVNVNKLYQPWKSFASMINKCLTGKSSGVDSFRLSQAQMLWRFYHRINIDFAYLIWEDFVYQVEHKNQKRSNKMNYPRFTKVIIDYFMTRKPSIFRRNRINWHYVRDDALFSTIKVGDSASSTTPPTPTPTTTVESAPRLAVTAKGKQPTRSITLTEPTDVQRT